MRNGEKEYLAKISLDRHNMQIHKSTGKIIYDPHRNMDRDTKWWCVLELQNDELPKYLRSILDTEWWTYDSSKKKRGYHKPPHKAHISVIRGETPRENRKNWKKFLANKTLTFEYSLDIQQTAGFKNEVGEFWFVKTVFPEFNVIRNHFGLDTERNGRPFSGHLTFARTYDIYIYMECC